MDTKNIRNFSIIAHIDHGKSTLADRMLEVTGTIEKRKMQDQVLDSMDLERERGITIKMQPVRMEYTHGGTDYVLNLIDTPGHIDFAYEVSRALTAVEGAVLLVDSTQGVQAQTLSTLEAAQAQGLKIIPAVTKIDAQHARPEEIKEEIAELLKIDTEDIYEVSGKTGEGVAELLQTIIELVPPPAEPKEDTQALVFDFAYSDHKGVIVFVRLFGSEIKAGDELEFIAGEATFKALEVGVFAPDMQKSDLLTPGTIGYIVTAVKEAKIAPVGDTLIKKGSGSEALSGYMNPKPVVWASVYPESQDDFDMLKHALEKLQLTDASLSYEEETSTSLGRGFRCGFLGMLHLEIITERLLREFTIELVVTAPSVSFVIDRDGKCEHIYTPARFPEYGDQVTVYEPWIEGRIIARPSDIGSLMQLLYTHEAEIGASETFGELRTEIMFAMPLRELYRDFFDELKSVTSGFASLAYEIAEERIGDVVKMDILVAEEEVPALARVVSRRRVEEDAKRVVGQLHELLPKQMFATKIQARAVGRIVSSKTLSAARKDVTAKLYGGDITRKKKLLEKQKKGKKKMKERGKGSVHIPSETFMKMLRPEGK